MKMLQVDEPYLREILHKLLEIPSPTGYTDQIVHFVGEELGRMEIDYELTRRGAIRATLQGTLQHPGRALIAHLDTLGAMVKLLKPNGRLEITSIGTWSARFAEGSRVTILTRENRYRGTILPLKASGHIFHEEIDTQPSNWRNLEVRVDERCASDADLRKLGIEVGDYITIDPAAEFLDNGFINARHLDDKAGVACLLAAARAVIEHQAHLPVNCNLLFTISEEVGSGASAVLHGDVAEMVAIDNGTPGPGQNGTEFGVTAAMMDRSGPYDYHLNYKLIDLCRENGIECNIDVFNQYRSDAASAVEAGNDIRTALVCFGVDASHGYERTHLDSLLSVTRLATLYMQSPLIVKRDRQEMGPLTGFPTQPLFEELPRHAEKPKGANR